MSDTNERDAQMRDVVTALAGHPIAEAWSEGYDAGFKNALARAETQAADDATVTEGIAAAYAGMPSAPHRVTTKTYRVASQAAHEDRGADIARDYLRQEVTKEMQPFYAALATPPAPTGDATGAHEDRGAEALWLLRQIIDDLPVSRDWLNPGVERQAKALLATPPAARGEGADARDAIEVLRSVAMEFRKIAARGDNWPHGFDSRVFRWVEDAIAGYHPQATAQSDGGGRG